VFQNLTNLFYPHLCTGCNQPLKRAENAVCTACLFNLPYTGFFMHDDNPVAKMLWGRIQVKHASALLNFEKGNIVQNLLHQLKYNGRDDTGEQLGVEMAKAIARCEALNDVSALVPVPLHPKKLKQRGYNQSEIIAKGINQSLNIPLYAHTLTRRAFTQTQTQKKKFSRWENMQNVFELNEPHKLENQHILIIDDVITTGATIEACVQQLQQINGVTVSVAALAWASLS
jgi:ComF family protein